MEAALVLGALALAGIVVLASLLITPQNDQQREADAAAEREEHRRIKLAAERAAKIPLNRRD